MTLTHNFSLPGKSTKQLNHTPLPTTRVDHILHKITGIHTKAKKKKTKNKKRKIQQEKNSAEPMEKLKAKGKTPYTWKFGWGWKQDNKGNPIRNWLRTTVQRAKNVLWFLYRKRGPCKNPLNTHDLRKSSNVWCVWWNVWCPGMRHQTKCLVC